MSTLPQPVRLFIGSSAEGLEVARNLQAELEANRVCEVERWDHNVFEPSGYTLDSLLRVAKSVDFAVLVASPDDVTKSREVQGPSVRDNIILEFGLFTGVLGRERTYLLATGDKDLKLPSDMRGLTRLPFQERSDDNVRAALNAAVLQIERQVKQQQARQRTTTNTSDAGSPHDALALELERLCDNAVAQGWTVKTNSPTTLRLISPKGKSHTLTKGQPSRTRDDLRPFVARLRAAGLRVNNGVRRPVGESPF